MLLAELREEIVFFCRKMAATGLTPGTTGNISAFSPEEGVLAISPSGLEYESMTAADVVVLDLEGNKVEGQRTPSSEYELHRVFYARRPEVRAVVHTHSTFATTLACLGWELPAIHYILAFAGDRVPCAPYVTYGTPELAEAVFQAADNYNAVLMGNHGLLALGADLKKAFLTASSVEYAAEIFWRARSLSLPNTLGADEMARVQKKFASYGQQNE